MKLRDLQEAANPKELAYAEFRSPELRELIERAAAHRLAAELEDENLEKWYQDRGPLHAQRDLQKMMQHAAVDILEDMLKEIKGKADLDKVFKKLYTKDYNILTGKHEA